MKREQTGTQFEVAQELQISDLAIGNSPDTKLWLKTECGGVMAPAHHRVLKLGTPHAENTKRIQTARKVRNT